MMKMRWTTIVAMAVLLHVAYPWCLKTILSQTGPVQQIDFTQDSTLMLTVSSGDNYVNLWNVSTLNIISRYTNHSGANILTAKFSRDGTNIAIGYSDGWVWIVSVSAGAMAYSTSFNTGSNTVTEVDYAWGGLYFLACGQSNLYVYNFPGYSSNTSFTVSGNTFACKFGPTTQIVVSFVPNKLFLFLNLGASSSSLGTKGYNAVDVSPNTSTVYVYAGSTNGQGYVYSPQSSLVTLMGNKIVHTVSTSKDGNYAMFGGQDNATYILNTTSNNNTVYQFFRDSSNWLVSSRFSFNNKLLAVGSNTNQIYIYSLSCIDVQCPPGTYLSSSQCLTCNIMLGCSICSGPATCLACYFSYYLAGSSCNSCSTINACVNCANSSYCYQCMEGYYLSATNTCTLCNALTTGCISCFNTSCIRCNMEYYLNSTDSMCYICSAAIPHCLRCTSNTVCKSCMMGYYANTVCSLCISPCLICLNASYCQQCIRGYYTNSTTSFVCTVCGTNCVDCNGAGQCTNCIQGWYPNASGVCTNCPLNCISCQSSTYCDSCQLGYYVTTGSCSVCGTGCATCISSSNCTSCVLGYYLNSSVCQTCVSTYNYCATCDGSSCISCQTGYYVNAGACSLCYMGCSSCSSSSNTSCSMCQVGYYFVSSNNSCSGCGASCIACASSSNCSSCAPGYLLSSTSCVSCPSRCNTCSSASVCTSCYLSYYLNGSNCSSCSVISSCIDCYSSTVCKSCALGTYLYVNTTSNVTCASCPGYCSSCNASTCFQCGVSYYLNGTICSPCTANCSKCSASACLSCNAGYFLNGSACSPCISPCLSCNTTSTTCYSCQNGHYLSNAATCIRCDIPLPSCLQCNTSAICTLCSFGYYISAVAATNNTCVLCSAGMEGCLSCISSIQCSNCIAGYYLNSNNTCTYCNKSLSCAQCTATACLSCTINTVLVGSTCNLCSGYMAGCDQCSSNTTCTHCQAGYYLNSPSCSLCSSAYLGCITCNSSVCFSCQDGYYLNAGICSSCASGVVGCQICNSTTASNVTTIVCLTCQSNYYLSGGSCLVCNSVMTGCLACSNASQCKVCLSSYYLSSSTCLLCSNAMSGCLICANSSACLSCSSGYYLNTTTTSCLPCQAVGCQICLQSNKSACISCQAGYYQVGATCSSCSALSGCNICSSSSVCIACGTGYYLLPNNTCQLCSIGCGKCSSAVACLQCQSMYYQSSGTCNLCGLHCETCTNSSVCLSCMAGFYVNGTQQCSICTDLYGCQICISSTQCIDCMVGYLLNGSACIACSSVLSNCYSCFNASVCFACESGYKMQPNGDCQLIKLGSAAPFTVNGLTLHTEYASSSALKHVLMIQGNTFNQASQNWTSVVNISLYCSTNNSLLPLTIINGSFGPTQSQLTFYSNNPIPSLSQINTMPFARLLFQTSSFDFPYKTKFSMTPIALKSILPYLLPTQTIQIQSALSSDPAFISSVLAGNNVSWWIIGVVATILLFVIFGIKSLCFPSLKDHGDVIPHLFCVKTIAILIFPAFPQTISYCYGFLAADLPYLSYLYASYLGSPADNAPLGYALYFSNCNFASMWLVAGIVSLLMWVLGFIAFRSQQQQVEPFKIQGLVNENTNKYDAYCSFLFNFFGFGLIYASCSSLVATTLNPFSSLSINVFFYILGIVIYVIACAIIIKNFYLTKEISQVRVLLKGSLLAAAWIAPIYFGIAVIIADIGIIVLEQILKGSKGRGWIRNVIHILANLAFFIMLCFSFYKITLIIAATIVFLIVVLEFILFCREVSNLKEKSEKSDKSSSDKNDQKRNEGIATFKELESIDNVGEMDWAPASFNETVASNFNNNASKAEDWDGNLFQDTRKNRRNRKFNKKGAAIMDM